MEILTRTVLALLLGHLLTDFVFQTSALVQRKKSGRAIGHVKNGAVYLLSAVVLTGFFVPGVFFVAFPGGGAGLDGGASRD
jgi:hypothetical protein